MADHGCDCHSIDRLLAERCALRRTSAARLASDGAFRAEAPFGEEPVTGEELPLGGLAATHLVPGEQLTLFGAGAGKTPQAILLRKIEVSLLRSDSRGVW